MGALSSSLPKIGWAVAWRRCFNGSTIPVEAPNLEAKLVARELNQPSLSLRLCFVKASPTVEKGVSC